MPADVKAKPSTTNTDSIVNHSFLSKLSGLSAPPSIENGYKIC